MANILVVEDDRIISTVIVAIVNKAGHKIVSVARTATDAVRLATVHRPDLVIMDIGLENGGDGIEAASHITDDLEIPVIFLTGHNDLVTLERAQKVNPLGFLSKPVREADVVNTITIALNQQKQHATKVPSDDSTFNGRIDMLGGIASVLEMVKVIHSHCALRFEDSAVLYIAEGKIIHAKLEDLPPMEAAKKLLARNQGMFRLDPDSEPEAGRSLSLDITTVLLNLAKEADEAHKNGTPTAGDDSSAVDGTQDDSLNLLTAAPQPEPTPITEPPKAPPSTPASTNPTPSTLAPTKPRPHDEASLAGFPFVGEVNLSRDMGKPLVTGRGVVHLPDKRYLSEFKATLLPISYQGCADNSQGRHYIDATVRIINMTEGDKPLTLECQFSSTGLEVEVSTP
ncbi:MAG: response regulator [Deinococcota bacterium]